MTLETWPLYVAAVLVAAISPGPNVLIVMTHSLRYGWQNAIWTVAGNLVCLFLVACLAALGIGAILQAQPVLYAIMKTVGAMYLILMGVKIIRGSLASASISDFVSNAETRRKAPAPITLMRQAFIVSASNPKSVLFLSAIFPQFLDRSSTLAPQFAVLFATLLLIVLVVHGSYAVAASSLRHRLVRPKARQLLERFTGGAFVILGAGVLVSKQ
ncbi:MULTISPECIES: LysE family translocator [unclassified Roseibium]|uniref:LysE family translocator n=1 Tax=unclassified Roseibium TaxID=2629323 RepID=UPI00317C2510